MLADRKQLFWPQPRALFQKPIEISMIIHWGNWVKVISHWTFSKHRSIDIHWKLSHCSLTKYFNEYPVKIQLLFIGIDVNIGWTFNGSLFRFNKMWLFHKWHNEVTSLHINSACLIEKLSHWCILRRTTWSDGQTYKSEILCLHWLYLVVKICKNIISKIIFYIFTT
jgi:hypothetical protein